MSESNHSLRLNLGCGLHTPPGWVNIDGSWNARLAKHPWFREFLSTVHLMPAGKADIPWSSNIFLHDIRKKLPFADGSASAVYASHVLEHLYREEGRQLIVESFRVLASGGVLRVVVPDLNLIIREYLGERPFGELTGEAAGLPAADRVNERLLMRWPSPARSHVLYRIYESWQDFHSHKWMYDAESLVALLQSVGFVEAQRKECLDSRLDDIKKVEDPGRVANGAGVAVECVKP